MKKGETEKEFKLCDEKWREDFEKFLNTGGEASEEFLTHLDNCSVCQAAADRHLEKEVEEILFATEKLRQGIREWERGTQKRNKKLQKTMLYLVVGGLVAAGLTFGMFLIFA
jgi:hypothetical protein